MSLLYVYISEWEIRHDDILNQYQYSSYLEMAERFPHFDLQELT